MDGRTTIIAHRGNSSAAPENTLAAFESALEGGIEAVELDVRLSGDGRVIVMHDDTVDRTTDGSGRLSDMTLAEIKKLDAGAWFASRFTGEAVPTLEEALLLMRGRAGVYIEIKEKEPALTDKILETLRDTGTSSGAVIISFYEEVLRQVKAVAPDQITSLLSCNPDIIDRALATGCNGVQPLYTLVDRPFTDRARTAGLFTAVWTVDDPDDLQRMLDSGVDAVTTNRPLEMLGYAALHK